MGLFNKDKKVPVRRDKDHELSGLQGQINRIFDDFWSEPWGSWPTVVETPKDFNPSLDVKESKNGYVVGVELAGIDQKDIDLSFEDNTLTIKGEKKFESEKEEEEGKVFHSERYYGSFYRRLPFREEIDPEKINASFKDGVLKVNLEKVPHDNETKRKIEIK